MKKVKLYNIIFPIWFLMFFPPVILLTLIGNFVIDSLVIVICFFIFGLAQRQHELLAFYKKTILKVWLFGFLADFIGAVILFLTQMPGTVKAEWVAAICYDPFSQAAAVVIILFAMLVSALFIFLFNYRISLKKQITDVSLRVKIALAIAIITMPWTFLLPTKWFYHGM